MLPATNTKYRWWREKVNHILEANLGYRVETLAQTRGAGREGGHVDLLRIQSVSTNSAPTNMLKNKLLPLFNVYMVPVFHPDLHLENICFTNSQIKSQLKAVWKCDWHQSILYYCVCLHFGFDYWCVVTSCYSKDTLSLFSVLGFLIVTPKKLSALYFYFLIIWF